MTPGAFVRRVLGDRLFKHVVARYRAVFVDLDAVAACVPDVGAGGEILDVGGGDGALLDRILSRQSAVRASLVDTSANVGLSLEPERRARVRLFPSTRIRDLSERGVPAPDAVVVADVLHHVRREERLPLLRDLASFCPEVRYVVVKEVAASGWRAHLGLLSDRYVTGDRHTELLTPGEVTELVTRSFPRHEPRTTPLLERDPPNYCIVFERMGG